MISFKEFKAVDLRAGKIEKIQDNKVKVNIGGKTVLCKAKNIKAKPGEVIVVAVDENKAMLLAAKNTSGEYSLTTLEGEVEAGTKVE